MNYSSDVDDCRVDIFKPSGKWYTTIKVSFTGVYDVPLIHDAFKKALRHGHFKFDEGFQAICLEPYHVNEHPVSVTYGKGGELRYDGEEQELQK